MPQLANLPWWDLFQDPQLQELIRIALEENKDLKIAVERIEEARAFYGFQKADFYPQVDANASAGGAELSHDSVSKIPEDIDTSKPLYQLSAQRFLGIGFFWKNQTCNRSRKSTLVINGRRTTIYRNQHLLQRSHKRMWNCVIWISDWKFPAVL